MLTWIICWFNMPEYCVLVVWQSGGMPVFRVLHLELRYKLRRRIPTKSNLRSCFHAKRLSVQYHHIIVLQLGKVVMKYIIRHCLPISRLPGLFWTTESCGKPILYKGDSMWKVREKRSTSKSGFFVDEMWKIIRKFDDFDRFLTTFGILGCF